MAAVATPTAAPGIPKIYIITAHSIQKKTSQCLQMLYPDPPKPSAESPADPNPAVKLPAVAFTAKSQAASKAITIAEIVKRRIREQGDNWYQYSALSSVMIEQVQQKEPSKNKQTKRQKQNDHNRNNQQEKEKRPHKGKECDDKEGEDEGEEEDPFTPMKEKPQPAKKKVPLLTIYISRSRLPELARLYG